MLPIAKTEEDGGEADTGPEGAVNGSKEGRADVIKDRQIDERHDRALQSPEGVLDLINGPFLLIQHQWDSHSLTFTHEGSGRSQGSFSINLFPSVSQKGISCDSSHERLFMSLSSK
ncbi:hypothetical protein E2C01_033638 [Portunus trituberculatus]|uniref:Uncharacterized protein n=1 Tax=Portunus trituberculatus TaxID=210409 RepID=A0A5B7F374_PORTR|nr:hypothetical protein [Portunus trituberculatus]